MSTETDEEVQSPEVSPTLESTSMAVQVVKNGTLQATSEPPAILPFPNRIFVGGIPASTTEVDLKTFFATFGKVKDTKVIADRSGTSKGYGFVTFEEEKEANQIIEMAKNGEPFIFKERKLNIDKAYRKINRPGTDPNLSNFCFVYPAAPYNTMMTTPYFATSNGAGDFAGQQTIAVPSQQLSDAFMPMQYCNPAPVYIQQPVQYQYPNLQLPATPTAIPTSTWPVTPQTMIPIRLSSIAAQNGIYEFPMSEAHANEATMHEISF